MSHNIWFEVEGNSELARKFDNPTDALAYLYELEDMNEEWIIGGKGHFDVLKLRFGNKQIQKVMDTLV